MVAILPSLIAYAALAAAGPAARRAVDKLDAAATEEAQQRDGAATRAFSDVQIKTSDGRCLFVDELSGDFRANLTPIQVGACGATDGQGWDIITSGKHIDAADSMLIVSTLTQACFNFDPRRPAGNQVLLFSCGGRADGGGEVTNSQLFAFDGGAGPISFQPENEQGACFTVNGDVLDVAECSVGDANQSFTFGQAAAANGDNGATNGSGNGNGNANGNNAAQSAAPAQMTAAAATTTTSTTTKMRTKTRNVKSKSKCTRRTTTVTVTVTADGQDAATSTTAASSSAITSEAATTDAPGVATANPTEPVPVSRAGGTLNPSAAAEANRRDDTATRAFSSAEIRAPDGRCLFVDPTAGDFRQNLIPVGLVECGGTPNEKWDVITAGVHNNKPASALIVSSLTQGCISFDGRRQDGDTITLFSCGGRADGGGETNSGQLMPFIGALSFAFAPESENGKICMFPGDDRLDSGPCPQDLGPQLFSIFPQQ